MPRGRVVPKPALHQGKVPMVLESEQTAVGAALCDQESAEFLSTELALEDFYASNTSKIFDVVQHLIEEGLAVTAVSVSERAGIARSEIDDLADRARGTSPSQLKTLSADIRRVSELRSIFLACQNTSSLIGTDSKVEEAMEALEKSLYRMDRTGSQEPQDGVVVLERVKSGFLARANVGGGPQVSTGLKELDKAIISLSGPKVYVVAARPSMGKTALSGTLRRSVLSQGLGVIEFNLEMGADEILERDLAFKSGLNLRKILSAKDITPDELQRVQAIVGDNFQGRWFIDDRTYNIAGMRRKARILAKRMARNGIQVGCVIIDYIQLAGDNGEGREQSVAAISRNCKLMAKELRCPIVALSQLNRSCEYREDRRPQLSDLRESGSIEQDADVVMFIYREHLYDTSFPAEDAELIIRKQRNGPIGTVRLHYNPKLVTFEDKKVIACLTPEQSASLHQTSSATSQG